MKTQLSLRLQQLIAREIKRCRNVSHLAQLINDANSLAGSKLKVDRRTLMKIRDEPEKVGLTLNTLNALNHYFAPFGEGLHKLPILASRGLVEPLFDAQRLVFVLGAKARPKERRVDLNRWDAWALAELVRVASRVDRRFEFDIEAVLWRCPVNPSAIKSEKWYSLLEMEQTSVISIGAPLATISSEVMLARMFNVAPFERPQFSLSSALPFYFVWAPKLARGFRSAFGLTYQELERDFPRLAKEVRENRTAAFILNGQPIPVPLEAKSWTMHGVIAAQRRACGSVWLVISGLAGPATLAAARLVKQIEDELPTAQNQNSKVLWFPISVPVTTGQQNSVDSGDVREIGEPVLGKPEFWPKNTP